MRVTKHAKKRMRQRKGTIGNSAQVARRAFREGIRHNETTGQLNQYISSRVLRSDYRSNNIRICHDFVYVFNGDTLVTVWPLPPEYTNDCKEILARRQDSKSRGSPA